MSRIHGPYLNAMALLVCLAAGGCHTVGLAPQAAPVDRLPLIASDSMPRELSKVVLPEYVIEPPDILTIEGIHIVPKPPYRLRALDVLSVQVTGTLPEAPIAGPYAVEPGGLINLGVPYGAVSVAGKTVEEAEAAILAHLRKFLQEPEVSASLAQMAAAQQVIGEFLVGPDGSVTLGTYGRVSVVGKTLGEAKAALETHLAQFLDNPEISLNVFAYNSKVYYIVLQGAGLGDGVFRLPVTGNETVLDAIAQIQGLEQVSSKRIWVARPSRATGNVQILPVDWFAITEQASPATNYQILPGDRVFIAEDKWIAWDTQIAKITAPLERIMGFSLLGVGTATRFSGPVLKGGGNPNNTGF